MRGTPELAPGSTALVVGPARVRESFCARELARADRAAAAVLPADPAAVVDAHRRAGGAAPLTLVVDEFSTASAAGGEQELRTVAVDAASLPAIGEAALGTLEGNAGDRPADRLWVADLSGLLDGASVQQVYRLLYILSKHVRKDDGVGLYGLDPSVEPKTARILRQALDYEITLEPDDEPEIRTLAAAADGVA
jgi:hypothetical protein